MQAGMCETSSLVMMSTSSAQKKKSLSYYSVDYTRIRNDLLGRSKLIIQDDPQDNPEIVGTFILFGL